MNDFRVLLFAAAANRAVVLGSLLAGILLAAIVNLVQPITYTTSSFLFVATPNWNDMTAIDDPSSRGNAVVTYGDQFTQQRMVSYGKLGSSDLVLETAAKKLGGTVTASQLRSDVTVQPVPETVMLEVRSTDPSPAGAVNSANAVAESLVETIKTLERPDRDVASPVQPLIIRPAALPSDPSSPQLILNLLVGAAVGILAGVTFAAWRTGIQLRSAAAITSMLRSGDALGVLPIGSSAAGDPISDESARLLAVRLRPLLDRHSAALVLIVSPRGTDVAYELAELLAGAFREFGFTATATPPIGDDSATALDAETTQTLRTSNDYVFVSARGLLESAGSVDIGRNCDAVVMACPVPESTVSECVEAESLVRLAGSPFLGRVIITTASEITSRSLDRAIASSATATTKDV